MTRPLTEKKARRCEEAKGERCRCRCAGRLHGAQRRFDFLTLDDPHFVERESVRGRETQSAGNVLTVTTRDLDGSRPCSLMPSGTHGVFKPEGIKTVSDRSEGQRFLLAGARE